MAHGHKNKHNHCDHCLHDCGPCDTAYCCKCPKRWVNCHQSHWQWYPYYTSPTISTPYHPSYGTLTSGSTANTLTASADPVLAKLWDNPDDAIYDTYGEAHNHGHN